MLETTAMWTTKQLKLLLARYEYIGSASNRNPTAILGDCFGVLKCVCVCVVFFGGVLQSCCCLVFCIADAVLHDCKGCFGFRQAGGVKDLADPGLATAFPQRQPGGGGVRHDVPADWF